MVSSRRQARAGALVLLGLALSGCASQACTTLGCESSVVVDVSAVQGLGSTQAGRVKVCLGTPDNCVLTLAPAGQHLVKAVFTADTLPAAATDPDSSVVVYVSVMNPGQVLVDGQVTTTLDRVAPNGESCGPVCYSAKVVASDRGISAVPVDASASPSG